MFTCPGSRIQTKRVSLARSATRQYWTRKYHALSPGAWVYLTGSNQTWNVPPDRTWYAGNTWFINIGGNGPMFHRTFNVETNLFELPGGTQITTSAQSGFLYYFDPEALPPPADPEGAYYARLARMATLPLSTLKAAVTAGAAGGTQPTASFPATFTNAMLRGVSSNELAWTIFTGAQNMNTQPEVSDNHQNRAADLAFGPFARATFSGIMVAGASVSGNGTDVCLGGTGIVTYQILPANW